MAGMGFDMVNPGAAQAVGDEIKWIARRVQVDTEYARDGSENAFCRNGVNGRAQHIILQGEVGLTLNFMRHRRS